MTCVNLVTLFLIVTNFAAHSVCDGEELFVVRI